MGVVHKLTNRNDRKANNVEKIHCYVVVNDFKNEGINIIHVTKQKNND